MPKQNFKCDRFLLKVKVLMCIMLLFITASCNPPRVRVPGHLPGQNSDSLRKYACPLWLREGRQSFQTCHQPRTHFILLLGRTDSILWLHLLVGAAFYKELKCATECHLDSVKLDWYKVECVRDKNGVIFLDLFKFKKL